MIAIPDIYVVPPPAIWMEPGSKDPFHPPPYRVTRLYCKFKDSLEISWLLMVKGRHMVVLLSLN